MRAMNAETRARRLAARGYLGVQDVAIAGASGAFGRLFAAELVAAAGRVEAAVPAAAKLVAGLISQ